MQEFIIILGIYIASYLIPLIIYYRTRKYQDDSMVLLAWLFVISALVDAFSLVNWGLKFGVKINVVNNFFGLFETAIVSKFYQTQISPGKKWPITLLALATIAMQLTEMLVFRSPNEFSGTTRTVFGATVTIFALIYFFKVMRVLPSVHIYHTPMFWINAGMLVFFTGNLFLYMIENYLVDVMKNTLVTFWAFHNFLGIVANIIFAIGLWQARRKAVVT